MCHDYALSAFKVSSDIINSIIKIIQLAWLSMASQHSVLTSVKLTCVPFRVWRATGYCQ